MIGGEVGFFSSGAVKALKRQGDTEGLLELATDRSADHAQRRKAVEALGDLEDSGVVWALLPLLRDLAVRRVTADALGKIGDFGAAGALLEATSTHNSVMKAACNDALAKLYAKDPLACKKAVAAWGEDMDQGVRRIVTLCHDSVEDWQQCPMCQVVLEQRTQHIVRCTRCDRYFCDPAWSPDVSFAAGRNGLLRGERKAGLYPAEMVRDLGFEAFPPGGSSFSTFPVTLVFKIKEDPSAVGGRSLATDGALMRRLAEFLQKGGPEG
jgi:ribosomal protein L37AE/L43A